MAALTQDSLFTAPNTIRCARLGCGRLVNRTLAYGVFCSPDCYVAQHRPKARKPARTSRPRDSQRSKVYKAERKAFPLMLKQEFDSLADCQEWLDTLLDEWWLKSRWGTRRVPIRSKRSGNAWASFDGTMALPKWAWNRWVILHELAHVLNGVTVAGHGPEYCAIYLELVRGHLGPVDAQNLRQAFDVGAVKYLSGLVAVPKGETRRSIVVQVFPDGSAWVRIGEGPDEGQDVPLTAAQVGPVEPGEAGWLVGLGLRDVRFVRRDRGS